MRDLSLEELCHGMLALRDNAAELLEEARLLRRNGRTSRAYALAYMACEETGKLSILIGIATKLVIGVPVDWKKAGQRFHSHSSKASQFFGMAKAMPMLLEAVASGQKTVDGEQLMQKAAAGVFVGPALFTSRNRAIYCDFAAGNFVRPAAQIDGEMADLMLQFAETNITVANSLLTGSAENVAKMIRSNTSRDRYERSLRKAGQLAGGLMELAKLNEKAGFNGEQETAEPDRSS